MKKRRFACLALAAPVLLLAGCAGGTSRLTLSANWYSASDITSNISNTSEKLEYSVSFESTGTDALTLSYDPGKYTVELRNDTVNTGTRVEQCYYLSTRLEITGRYIVNGETGEDFTDVVTSEAWFLDVTTELRPVKSVKKVLTHSTTNSAPDKPENAYTVYEYTYTTTYNEDCSEAQIKIEYTRPEEVPVQEVTVDVTGDGSYLDNETILFAMRGISPSVASTFRTINPVTQTQVSCGMTAVPTTESGKQYTFAVNGTSEDRTPDVYSFTIGYSGNYAGQTQELTYAAKVTEGGVNTYRNVLLEMRVPALQSLGTLVYKLTSAEFNGK